MTVSGSAIMTLAVVGSMAPSRHVRIPRQPQDRDGRRMFDPSGIEKSPIGKEGWMLHGSPDASGLFTVEALEPRRLFMLRADQRIEGRAAGLRHVANRQLAGHPIDARQP
jgi:predicted Abi (CAAX) family protease